MARAHRTQGGQVQYSVQPFKLTPMRAACSTAFSSAWQMSCSFSSRSFRRSVLSVTPRGSPLNPVLRISRSGPTTTQPICVLGSLLQDARCLARSMNRRSQAWFQRWLMPGWYTERRELLQPTSHHRHRLLTHVLDHAVRVALGNRGSLVGLREHHVPCCMPILIDPQAE